MFKKLLPLIIALVAGIVFIVTGCSNISQVKNFPEVNAVVTRIDTEITTDSDGTTTEDETVYVEYTVDDQTYNEVLQYAPGSVNENDEIVVRYNPEKPDYVTGATKNSGVVRIVVGAVLIVAGLLYAILKLLRVK